MKFRIRFVERMRRIDPEWGPTRIREVRAGGFRRRFTSPLARWSEADFEHQWLVAAMRLLDGKPAGFWTIPWQFWWVGFPHDDEVSFSERLVLPEMLEAWGIVSDNVGTAPHDRIEPAICHDDDELPIPEWRVSLASVRYWVDVQMSRRVQPAP